LFSLGGPARGLKSTLGRNIVDMRLSRVAFGFLRSRITPFLADTG
jgi:hypothetical protein